MPLFTGFIPSGFERLKKEAFQDFSPEKLGVSAHPRIICVSPGAAGSIRMRFVKICTPFSIHRVQSQFGISHHGSETIESNMLISLL